TAACTGLTIGGTAVGFLFDTATSVKVVFAGVGPIPSPLWLPKCFLSQRSRHASNTGLRLARRTRFQTCVPSRSPAITRGKLRSLYLSLFDSYARIRGATCRRRRRCSPKDQDQR